MPKKAPAKNQLFALRLFIDDKWVLPSELAQGEALIFAWTALHLNAYLTENYKLDAKSTTTKKKKKTPPNPTV